jgi:outer membrane autotransporter protein
MNGKLALPKIAAFTAVAVALCFPADAADLRVRPYGKAPAPPAPMIYNWTGFYVGANFGGAFTREDVATPLGTFSTDPSGVLGGVQIGYNYQLSPNWLLGIEGEFDWTSAQGTTNFASPITAFSSSSDHNWYGTLNGRLGYVQGAWLYYVKGGGAWMNADYRLVVNSGLGGAASISPNRNGWTIGAGAEYMLSPQWSAKLEYSYLDFGRNTYGFAIPGGGAGLTFNTQVHEVKVGANYHWAPGTLSGQF